MLSKGESKPPENNGNNDGNINNILQIKNLSKAYHTNGGRSNNSDSQAKYIVLHNINIDIKEGEFVTIVGPSGCGKSTFLNIIAGIDKEYSSDAEIIFNTGRFDSASSNNNDDRDSTHYNQDKILIFQEPALFPWLTVIENVEFGLKVAKLPKDKRKAIAKHYIEMVQLSNFANAYIHQLSGGMKQRIAIARALAIDPKILLMDEPFTALDVNTRQSLQRQLLQIHRATHKTILFVTHNIHEAVTLGDRVILFSRKLAGIKKQFTINLPHPRDPNHPIVDAMTKEIINEFREFELEGLETVEEYNDNGDLVAAAPINI
ncbi:MAG: ABC transporter ATP-binding protein [Nitrososphaeraceae archaeon]|nr:ABC transporter ATP-binding protein [Nitrososphaeraceae archaeon]